MKTKNKFAWFEVQVMLMNHDYTPPQMAYVDWAQCKTLSEAKKRAQRLLKEYTKTRIIASDGKYTSTLLKIYEKTDYGTIETTVTNEEAYFNQPYSKIV